MTVIEFADKYILNDVGYSGIQIDKMPPKEDA